MLRTRVTAGRAAPGADVTAACYRLKSEVDGHIRVGLDEVERVAAHLPLERHPAFRGVATVPDSSQLDLVDNKKKVNESQAENRIFLCRSR